MITHLHPVYQLWLAFDNIAGGRGWHIRESPRLGHYRADYFTGIVHPNDAQLKKDKQHVDGGVYPVVAGFHQHQAILWPQFTPEGKTAQLAAKTIAPLRLGDKNLTAF